MLEKYALTGEFAGNPSFPDFDKKFSKSSIPEKSMCVKVCQNVQKCAKVCQSMPRYAKE
ncbi:hypothetical protein TSAR_010859 [Trichomalopsis sarcophagae]|uniref:Uncharacterized protein n=1 Tax=Trichomalopsis sarcophagae TaxID=543379 RepID=A0A232EDX8_9HYME|nr:hypothetical protein TSAR_010859 [Trichomalopsis sarcophagae]